MRKLIHDILKEELKYDMKKLDTDKDLMNTYQHRISTLLCR